MPEMKTPFIGAVSIARFISKSGFCSYKDAVKAVNSSLVTLNGAPVSDYWHPVHSENDVVRVNGIQITHAGKRKYFALHKPVGYISSHSSSEGYPSIYDLVKKNGIEDWVTTAGRLDVDTSGLMILTNDSAFVRSLSHPETKIKKVYELLLDGNIDDQQLLPFRNGVLLGNGYTCLPADYEIVARNNDTTIVNLTLTEGKKRQIRRMCKVMRLNLLALKRIQLGKYKLENLQPGDCHEIQKSDII